MVTCYMTLTLKQTKTTQVFSRLQTDLRLCLLLTEAEGMGMRDPTAVHASAQGAHLTPLVSEEAVALSRALVPPQ